MRLRSRLLRGLRERAVDAVREVARAEADRLFKARVEQVRADARAYVDARLAHKGRPHIWVGLHSSLLPTDGQGNIIDFVSRCPCGVMHHCQPVIVDGFTTYKEWDEP